MAVEATVCLANMQIDDKLADYLAAQHTFLRTPITAKVVSYFNL